MAPGRTIFPSDCVELRCPVLPPSLCRSIRYSNGSYIASRTFNTSGIVGKHQRQLLFEHQRNRMEPASQYPNPCRPRPRAPGCWFPSLSPRRCRSPSSSLGMPQQASFSANAPEFRCARRLRPDPRSSTAGCDCRSRLRTGTTLPVRILRCGFAFRRPSRPVNDASRFRAVFE